MRPALMAMNRATPSTRLHAGVSSGQEAPKTASLSLTVLRVQHYCKFTDSSVRMFDQTQCPMLLYFLLYGCTCYQQYGKKKDLM